MKLKIANIIKLSFVVIAGYSLAGCITQGNLRPNLKNYTGADASTIYVYDDSAREYSLVTYAYNEKDLCYEKTADEQLVILRILRASETKGLNKFTIKPNKTYSIKSETYNDRGSYVSAKAFIPEPNKTYYLSFDSVVVMPDNPDAEYLKKLPFSNADEIAALPKAKGWNIKDKTCSNFWTGSL